MKIKTEHCVISYRTMNIRLIRSSSPLQNYLCNCPIITEFVCVWFHVFSENENSIEYECIIYVIL